MHHKPIYRPNEPILKCRSIAMVRHDGQARFLESLAGEVWLDPRGPSTPGVADPMDRMDGGSMNWDRLKSRFLMGKLTISMAI